MTKNLELYLKNLEVEHIYFCSGSRNSSLLDSFSNFKIFHRYDERSAAFEALGDTKITQKPVVVCTTSGTAVAECLPAVIEAYYSHQKLIIISADRPEHLRHSFAPQCIDQTHIFSTFIRSQFIGRIGAELPANLTYPAQINLEINDSEIENSHIIKSLNRGELSELITSLKMPLVLITHDHNLENEELEVLKNWNVYFYREAIANLEEEFCCGREILSEKKLIKLCKTGVIDGVIKFGATPVTKLWRELERSLEGIKIIAEEKNPLGLSYGYTAKRKDLLFLTLDYKLESYNELNTQDMIAQFPGSEPYIINSILAKFNAATYVYIGNSMPIRYVELIKNHRLHYICSRGANGIDGQIAQAIGIARNIQSELHLIIGDLTFLYDMNQLLSLPANCFLHVINNNGGRIFERVNVNTALINEHNLQLETIVNALGLSEQVFIYNTENEQTNAFWSQLDK